MIFQQPELEYRKRISTSLSQGKLADTTRKLDEASAGQALLIQEEVVDARKGLSETSARKTFYPRFLEKETPAPGNRQLLGDALAEKNSKAVEQLRADYNRVETGMQKAKKDMEKMKIPLGRRIALSFGGKTAHSCKIELSLVSQELCDGSVGTTDDLPFFFRSKLFDRLSLVCDFQGTSFGVREISLSWLTGNDGMREISPSFLQRTILLSHKSSFTEKLLQTYNMD